MSSLEDPHPPSPSNTTQHPQVEEHEDNSENNAKPSADGKGETHNRLRYNFPRADPKPAFSIPDMVWGKVKGYPSWPGQIFDPTQASKMAVSHQKKDRHLVAYFGDQTFAWCASHQLRPFLRFFDEMERQSDSEAFLGAVQAAVEEVERRAEVGMACSGVAGKYRGNSGVENGVAVELVDGSLGPSTFVAEEFLRYIQIVAACPKGELARIDLAVMRAHSTAYQRSKGYDRDWVYYEGGGLVENDGISNNSHGLVGRLSSVPAEEEKRPKGSVERLDSGSRNEEKTSEGSVVNLSWIPMDDDRLSNYIPLKSGRKSWITSSRKQKVKLEGGKERKSLSETSKDKKNSLDRASDKVPAKTAKSRSETSEYEKGSLDHTSDKFPAKKRKSLSKTLEDTKGSLARASDKVPTNKRKKIATSPFDISESEEKMTELIDDSMKKSHSPAPYPSFKVGEFIRRFASKLTNSSPVLKTNGETSQRNEAEDKEFVGHENERKETSVASSSSDAAKAYGDVSYEHGKAKSSLDEVVEPLGEIKSSGMSDKNGQSSDEDSTPLKNNIYSRRGKNGSGEDSTPRTEIKYARKRKAVKNGTDSTCRHLKNDEHSTPPHKEIKYSRRNKSKQSSELANHSKN